MSLVHKVSFPGAVYRNKAQFSGKIYCSRYSKCWAIFNIFTFGIETFVIPWDQFLYPCVVEVCRLGLEPLYCGTLISASLSIWRLWHWSDSNFLRSMKRWTTILSMLTPGVLLSVLMPVSLAPTRRTIFWTAPWQFCATKSGKSVRNRYWQSWRWISIGYMICAFKNYHRPHFTVGGSWNKSLHLQPLQRCYSGSRVNACVITPSSTRCCFT